jgi:hypothetical protein
MNIFIKFNFIEKINKFKIRLTIKISIINRVDFSFLIKQFQKANMESTTNESFIKYLQKI